MIGRRATIFNLALARFLWAPLVSDAFAPSNTFQRTFTFQSMSAAVEDEIDVRTGKPIGTAFLPPETVERCAVGSPIEKIKLAKDGTSALVDVYEYARKIREGEMTWEEVEKADLDSVCFITMSASIVLSMVSHSPHTIPCYLCSSFVTAI